MNRFLIFFLVALSVLLSSCYESLAYCEGEPKCISFPAEGGKMRIENTRGFSGHPESLYLLQIGANAYNNISSVAVTDDSIFVSARWLTTKQCRESLENLEIIAQPNESKKTRILYIIDPRSDYSGDDVIKIVQDGRK